MTRNLVNRQTVLALIAAVCFVVLAVAATSTFTIILAIVSVMTLMLAVCRGWFSSSGDYR